MKRPARLLMLWCVLQIAGLSSIFAQSVNPLFAEAIARNKYLEAYGDVKGVDSTTIFINLAEIKRSGTDTLYYVFNINTQDGWVIVSADKSTFPIIASASEGHYDTIHQPDAYKIWMENVSSIILAQKGQGTPVTKDVIAQWERYSTLSKTMKETVVGPLMQTNWDQGAGYNTMCPYDVNGPDNHALTGCIATAMGQVMKKHNYPVAGYGSNIYTPLLYGTQSVNFGATQYRWDLMGNNSGGPEIAKLLYHSGVATEMNYSPIESTTNLIKARNALVNYFRYSDSVVVLERNTNLEWTNIIRKQIDKGQPVIYAGTSGSNSGHAWVCDGYRGSYELWFNWGWGGVQNGWFHVAFVDTPASAYAYLQHAIVNIIPQPPDTLPVVATSFPITYSDTSALLSGYCSAGSDPILARGFCWGLQFDPDTNQDHVFVAGTTGSYNATIGNLASGSLYWYRAFVTTAKGIYYGNNISFRTIQPVTGISLSPSTVSLTPGGDFIFLNGQIFPSDATDQRISWSSSNPSVAAVSAGVVYPLAPGTATITAQTIDGGFQAQTIVYVIAPNEPSGPDLSRLEYYFDNDPGIGNRQLFPLSQSDRADINLSIDVSGLGAGWHKLHILAKDENQQYSKVLVHPFLKDIESGRDSAEIVSIEYYFDDNQSPGASISIPVTDTRLLDFSTDVGVSSLPDGFHTLHLHVKADNETRSFIMNHPFFKNISANPEQSMITLLEYYIDDDPGQGQRKTINFSDRLSLDLLHQIDVSEIDVGLHHLYILGKADNTTASFAFYHPFFKGVHS